MQTMKTKWGAFQAMSLALIVGLFADEQPMIEPFEGVLTYDLKTSGRDWKIEHKVCEGGSCTDIYLGTLKFQSVLQRDGAIYLIDVLGKRIVPIGHMGMGHGIEGQPNHEGDLVEPPEGFLDEETPSRTDGKQGGRRIAKGSGGDFGGGPGGPMPLQLADPEEPSGEGTSFEMPSLKFKFKAEKRKVEMEGIASYGTLPPQVFQQFKDIKEVGPVIGGTLNYYRLIPVNLEIGKRKDAEAVSMTLVSIEPGEIPATVLEFPEGFAMKMGMPGGAPEGERKGRGKGHGGAPPDGGRGQGMGRGM